jgi:hypothetical protein
VTVSRDSLGGSLKSETEFFFENRSTRNYFKRYRKQIQMKAEKIPEKMNWGSKAEPAAH